MLTWWHEERLCPFSFIYVECNVGLDKQLTSTASTRLTHSAHQKRSQRSCSVAHLPEGRHERSHPNTVFGKGLLLPRRGRRWWRRWVRVRGKRVWRQQENPLGLGDVYTLCPSRRKNWAEYFCKILYTWHRSMGHSIRTNQVRIWVNHLFIIVHK
jgi:hypothetical protein